MVLKLLQQIAPSGSQAVANGGHAAQAAGEERMISHVVFADLEFAKFLRGAAGGEKPPPPFYQAL